MNCTECGDTMFATSSGMVCNSGCGRIQPTSSGALQVIPIGTAVLFNGDMKGVITAVMIEAGERLTYRVAHWHQGTRNCEWLDDFEVGLADETSPTQIGFAEPQPTGATP